MNAYDDFVERLAAALEDEGGREDFFYYLQNLTRDERGELLAEADGHEAAAEVN